jgi:hypothetical protein
MAGIDHGRTGLLGDDKPKCVDRKVSVWMGEFELILLITLFTIFFLKPFNPSRGI